MKNNSTRNSILSGLFWKFGERLLNQGVAFIISIILARILAPEDYGTIALVTVFISLASVFISSGFATGLIQKKDADDTDFSTIFFCSLACSVLIYAVLFCIAPMVAAFYKIPVLTDILRVYALQIPLSVYHSIQAAYVSRHMLFRKVFISSVITSVLSGAVGIGMALAGMGVWALVAQSMASTVINTLVMMRLIPWHPQLKFSASSAKIMMKYGSRLLAADLSGTFFAELRSLIIGRVYTSADLAYYNKGNQVPAMITNNLSSAVMTVLFPAFANHSDDMETVKQMTRRSMRIMSYILIPAMFGLAVVMKPLILLLFTQKWSQAIPFGQILSIDLCISIFGSISLQVLKSIGRSDVVLKLEVWKKPMYLLFLIIGVNISVLGLAVAMVLYDIYANVVNMLQVRKYIHYGLREQIMDLLPAFGMGAAMALLVWIIPTFDNLLITLAVKVFAGAVIYVAGSWLFQIESFLYLKNMILGMIKHKKGA